MPVTVGRRPGGPALAASAALLLLAGERQPAPWGVCSAFPCRAARRGGGAPGAGPGRRVRGARQPTRRAHAALVPRAATPCLPPPPTNPLPPAPLPHPPPAPAPTGACACAAQGVPPADEAPAPAPARRSLASLYVPPATGYVEPAPEVTPRAIGIAFALVFVAGLCAPLGACLVFFLNVEKHFNMLPVSLALAAGVMVFISIYEVQGAGPRAHEPKRACMTAAYVRHHHP